MMTDTGVMPLTTLANDGFLQLHSADDNTVTWPRNMAVKSLAK